MSIDFPSSPTLNDTYEFGDVTWVWNGYAWIKKLVGLVGPTGPTGATGSIDSIPLATTGTTGVASFNGEYFSVSLTGHVSARVGIKAKNFVFLEESSILGTGATGALPALDGSRLVEVNAKFLQNKTPQQITRAGTYS